MSEKIPVKLKILSPSPTIGVSPVKLLEKVQIRAKYIYVQGKIGNKSEIWLSDNQAQALSKEGLVMPSWMQVPFQIDVDTERGVRVDLSNIWIHGDMPGDQLIVAYLAEEGEE